jgi:uncharacterized membrane protein
MDPVERTVQATLRAGIVLSLVLMVIGIVLAVVQGGGLPKGAVPLADLPRAMLRREPAAYLSLAMVVMIATPFVRVAGSLLAFLRQRDWRSVLVTALVFAVMCTGVFLGWA